MARISGMVSAVVLLLTIAVPSSASQICSFWDGGCLDALAQTAASFSFRPLFLDQLTFYYGYDANSRGKGHEPMTKVSYWLNYQVHHINNSIIDSNRTLEVAMRVGNLTGTPSGSNNGCDGVWGSQCSTNLKEEIQEAIYQLSVKGEYYDDPLNTVISQLRLDPPYLRSCPPQFFDVQDFPVFEFAQEIDVDKSAKLQPSGSSSNPWKTWYIDNMSDHQQAEQVAVAIFSRGPSYNSLALKSKDEIDLELVCVQAPDSGSTSNHDAA
ncbi:hypothetical protein BDW42DRAFT_95056 [Aspergillus taichungensis]|uniref:Uncharacterized protein n=1 Tax=Aspergillus taichungensis TaxID=482145 RepID=A0A2J5HVZ5_9EURO|nr:hypothetical protein BDW42DRAFT_95056 [Aspergillus taichungensis]